MPIFHFDPDSLGAWADRYAEAYRNADPFPHAMFDDFLPKEVAEEAALAFPSLDALPWRRVEADPERKLSFEDERRIPDPLRLLIWEFNSSVFVQFLERLTGIEGLVPDPHLRGGGLHRIERGGRLSIHCDFNWHKSLGLERRLNLLLFLNPDWQESWGGHLELWSRDMKERRQRILPVLNRCVIFTTDSDSFHGHPDPLACPPGRSRHSLALYYYQSRQRGRSPDFHTTLFRDRPGEQLEIEKKQRHREDLGIVGRLLRRLRR